MRAIQREVLRLNGGDVRALFAEEHDQAAEELKRMLDAGEIEVGRPGCGSELALCRSCLPDATRRSWKSLSA
jgi:hypothetical protein